MKKKTLGIFAAAIVMTFATSAMAGDCDSNSLSTRCGQVTQQEYGGGGSNPNVVPLTACISDPKMVDSMRLNGGYYAWETGFYYGTGEPEEVTTVENSPCWTEYRDGVRQHGNPGSYAVAFICCDYYCGWVGGMIGSDGRADMVPIRLSERHDPLRLCREANWAETGQYDRCALLN